MTHLFSTISFCCPSCKTPLSGSWEVLAPSEMYQLRCWECHTLFNGLMIVCEQCDADNFVMDTDPIASHINCHHCGHLNATKGTEKTDA
jgi:hypothetical protein